MRFKIIIFIILIWFSTQSNSHARTIMPIEGLEALRKAFFDTSDFTAEITQEKQFSIMKRIMTTNGIVRFIKPDLFLMEIKPPYQSRLLLRDNIIEQSSGNESNKNRIILPPEQSLKLWFSKLTTPVNNLPNGVDLRAEKNGTTYTLHILPVKNGQIKELTIIFQADGTIRKIIINEQNGDKATMTFRKFKKNTGLIEKDLTLN